MAGAFHLPVWFDLGATFAFALTGALAAIRRGYDIVGVFFLALATGLGGGLIRDGIFIPGEGPTPLLLDPRYIELVAAGTVCGALFGRHVKRLRRSIAVIDALGLGAYAAFGTAKALHAGLAVPAALLVGVINAAGGGLLRDIIAREEPLVFRPGQFYVLTALAGAVTFVSLNVQFELAATPAAIAAIAVTLVFRGLTIVFNWRTSAVGAEEKDVVP
ncbi:MAG TPA: TRIC cation channel family protein [Opitutaceae bacterium]|nr:TRIC cation channel family protein [Opitutaceae bacterium]